LRFDYKSCKCLLIKNGFGRRRSNGLDLSKRVKGDC
jgi:hypothetical protein